MDNHCNYRNRCVYSACPAPAYDYILSSQPKLVNTSLTLVSNGLQTELLTTVLLTTTSEYRVEK